MKLVAMCARCGTPAGENLLAHFDCEPKSMRADDLLSSSAWPSWRWWWHLARGGRVGTFCRSSRCRPCRAVREINAGRGWPPIPQPLPPPPPPPRVIS